MSILSDIDIKTELKAGNIVIDPFNENNLQTTSYDVTLGEYFYREVEVPESKRHGYGNFIYNIWDNDDVKKIWGDPIKAPLKQNSIYEAFIYKNTPYETFGILSQLKFVKDTDQVIWLKPGERILAHTNEFIGGINKITTSMQARSSMGRSFISVCLCAGFGDVGYHNIWTFEITNHSRFRHIPLMLERE